MSNRDIIVIGGSVGAAAPLRSPRENKVGPDRMIGRLAVASMYAPRGLIGQCVAELQKAVNT